MKKPNIKPCVLPLLLMFSTLFYYFGELVDWAAWDAVRLNFFYGVHDVHRLVFLAPIVYAGYRARIRGAVIITLVSFIIFLPRAFFISPYPDPLLRMTLFTVIAGVIGVLVGALQNQVSRARRLETIMAGQRDRMLQIINNMADGVMITGQDYRIRFMNARMVREFGEGAGSACYALIRGKNSPCNQDCRISSVINDKKVCRWICQLPDDRVYEVIAAPYIDADGTACQISIFRDVSPRQIP